MNIFQDLKEKKVLDKDGKVDPLGPYGKSKLTGQEVATYFKKNKVKDAKIKKAVEVALDLGGAFSVAQKEIKKFFGNSVLKNKDVQKALKHANESFEMNQLVGILHEDVFNLTEKNLMPDIEKIVDTKGAAKVGGVMIDMFTASVVKQVYDKVNDQNKKKMEKAKIEVLVKLAHKVMGMKEEVELKENEEGLKNKADKSGMPLGILKQVYKRGLAAYKTGHRPGTTAPQWAMARVNSFITKGSGTWGKADSDLAAKVKGESVESIEERKAMKLKDVARKYKREIEQLAKKGQSPEMGKHKVYMALYNLAWENGDINTDDPDQTDEVIDDYMDDMMGEFFAHIKEGGNQAQQAAIAISKKEKAGKPGYDKEGKSLRKEWIAADGTRRRVHEKDKRKKKNVMDSYRSMWEDAIEEDNIVEKKEFNPKAVEKIAGMTDKNDHNAAMLLFAREMREKKVEKMMNLLIQMHKEMGHMTSDMMGMRKDLSKQLFDKAKKTYSNFDDIYGAF